MKNLVNSVKNWLRNLDRVSRYTDGSFVYVQVDNPFSLADFPEGRYVFHYPEEKLPELEKVLTSQAKSRSIGPFKYALNPLHGEENPAVVLYARNVREKERIRGVLENLGVAGYEWRNGNHPLTFNFRAEIEELGLQSA